MSVPNLRCIFCDSPYHNYRNCTVVYRKAAQKQVEARAKQDYSGEAPNIFVGRHGYPSVNVGLLNVEEYEDHDDPKKWSKEGYDIPRIVGLRTSMINARHGLNIKSPSLQPPTGFSSRFLDIAKEVGLSKRPVDVEIGLQKKPSFRTSFSRYAAPHGPNVGVKRALLGSNPRTHDKLEKASSDTDLKATGAVQELFNKGVDEHAITRAFSVGSFGLQRNRKLVPTRWSITAVDDTAGKELIKEIKDHPEGDCTLYLGGHLGNHYLILFYDDNWQYELFEQFVPQDRTRNNIVPEHDYEPYHGRKTYAEETAGGYYATRIAVLEELRKRKRQASVLAIRIITEEYTAPLGVWVVREAVRKALANEPLRFPDRQAMTAYAQEYLQRRFGYDITKLLRDSQVLQNLNTQRKLHEY